MDSIISAESKPPCDVPGRNRELRVELAYVALSPRVGYPQQRLVVVDCGDSSEALRRGQCSRCFNVDETRHNDLIG